MRWLIEFGLFLIVVGAGIYCFKAWILPLLEKKPTDEKK